MERKTTPAKELATQETTCAICGKVKHPKRGYLALLKSQTLLYVCQSCRDSQPPAPMRLGKLGILR